MTDEQALAALGAERAIRAAARAGNRLIAGGVARVLVRDHRAALALTDALSGMGARLAASAGDREPDFVFVDDIDIATDIDVSDSQAAGRGLPAVVADLRGRVRSARGADPESRIQWAAAGMPATALLADRLRGRAAGGAPRVAVSLVLEPKTAAFARALAAAGCEVAVFGAVSETDPEIAAALVRGGGVTVFAPVTRLDAEAHERQAQIDAEHAAAILDWGPELLIDDGSHLLRLAHTERREALATLAAAAEETTSGVRPLREMAAEGSLTVPVISVNDARTKTGFDNLIGTGQSCVFAILDVLDPPERAGAGWQDHPGNGYRGVAGTHWLVIGYGPVGIGVARFAAALGALVTVAERDPVRALAAVHDGFEVGSLAETLPSADTVVSATGVWHTLDTAGFSRLRPGAAVAVAGGIDDELALDELGDRGWRRVPLNGWRAEWIAPGEAAGPIVLADGGGINYTAGEGNPIEVMDLSFATQLAALIRHLGEQLPAGVHAISASEEELVAQAALDARGATIDGGERDVRPGGAAQHWSAHRYRVRSADPGPVSSTGALDSSE